MIRPDWIEPDFAVADVVPVVKGTRPRADGLRGLAVVLVLVHHLMPWQAIGLHEIPIGWVGVDLFFVLSGFLITGILVDAKQSRHYFRNFYVRRMLRIFPLYYGVLIILFFVLPIGLRPAMRHLHFSSGADNPIGRYFTVQRHQIWLWIYLQNIFNRWLHVDWAFCNHFWSLAVEEHSYLVWPVLIWLCDRRGAIRACISLVLLALALRFLILSQRSYFDPYTFTPCRIDSLAIGGLTALLIRSPSGVRRW